MSAARRGYSLVELVVVVTLVGLIAAIAIPRYIGLQERAHIATIQGDLHHLRLMQLLHHRDAGRYAADVAELGERFHASPEVVIEIVEANERGYVARARHEPSGHACVSVSSDARLRCTTPRRAGNRNAEDDLELERDLGDILGTP